MKKILLLAFTISFIPLESQAEDKVCDVIGKDEIYEMYSDKTLGNCKAGNLIQVWNKYPTLSMGIMLLICEDKSIQIFKYEDNRLPDLGSAMIHASCRLMPVKNWRGESLFKD